MENLYMAPLAIIMILAPFIAHAHLYEKRAEYYLYTGENIAIENGIDFLGYWKAVFIVGTAVGMLLLLLYRTLTDEKYRMRRAICLIPLGLYALLAFLSACFSKYSWIAFGGMEVFYESVWVLLAYCVITFYVFEMLDTETMLKKLFQLFKIEMTVFCIYGIVEVLFGNPMSWEWMKNFLFSPSLLNQYGGDISTSFNGVSLAFFNYNYAASFLALTIPISVMAVVGAKEKKNKIWLGILLILQWVLLIINEARSGLIATLFSLLLLMLLFRKKVFKTKKYVVLGLLALALVYFAVEIPRGFAFTKRLEEMFTFTTEKASLEKIETLADSVEITYGGNTLSVRYQGCDNERPFMVSYNGEVVPYEKGEHGIWETEDRRFAQIQFAATGTAELDYFDVGIEGKGWRFIELPDSGGYYYVNPSDYLVKMGEAEKALPAKFWAIGNNRGYIWAKAIPLLKETVLLGSGPDTFYMVFPWNDYVDQSSLMDKEIFYNRAHSMYLQTGIQTGILSLLAFLVLVGLYAVQSFRLYWKEQERTLLSLLGIGILAGIFGYLITGLVNDSVVGVAQQYWLFLGTGLAVNWLVKEQKQLKKEVGKNEGI